MSQQKMHLGDLVCAALTSANNQTTAVPFDIPQGVAGLLFQTSAADVTIDFGTDSASPSTFSATTTDLALAANQAIGLAGPGYSATANAVCAAYSTGGATVHVYRLWGQS